MVKMGDHYLNGYGVEKDAEKAAACYYAAADMMHSAQAKWNLGWMHENGIGVEQDFHLAKRFYDQALETNKESYMPVRLSLLKLRFRSYWNTLTNGKINSIQSDPGKGAFSEHQRCSNVFPEPRKHRTWSEWLSNFLDQENEYYHLEDMDDEPLDHYHEPIPGGDEFYYDDVDEGIFESLIIITLAGALALLVYYRQVRQQNHQRAVEEQQRQQLRHGQPQAGGPTTPLLPGQQPDGGFFPPPDDPNFGNWVAGGIGH
jgi:SEL1 protein